MLSTPSLTQPTATQNDDEEHDVAERSMASGVPPSGRGVVGSGAWAALGVHGTSSAPEGLVPTPTVNVSVDVSSTKKELVNAILRITVPLDP
jgi:hypothetical protein